MKKNIALLGFGVVLLFSLGYYSGVLLRGGNLAFRTKDGVFYINRIVLDRNLSGKQKRELFMVFYSWKEEKGLLLKRLLNSAPEGLKRSLLEADVRFEKRVRVVLGEASSGNPIIGNGVKN